MKIPNRDGDGYLVDMSDWTPEIGRLMAEADGYELNVDDRADEADHQIRRHAQADRLRLRNRLN